MNNKLITGSVAEQHGTAHIGTERFDLETLLKPASTISNPEHALGRLAVLAPANEYFAQSAIVSSLGYYVINQLLWQCRDKTKPIAPQPTIDIFNESYATMFEKRSADEAAEDNGFGKLPTFDATQFTGVYMRMMYAQRGNLEFADRYPVTAPHVVLHEMQTQDRTTATRAAYTAVDDAIIDKSAVAAAIRQQIGDAKQRIDVAKVKQHEAEQRYVLTILRDTAPETMTDAKWESLPLYIQYKFSTYVLRNVLRAIKDEALKPERDTDNMPLLIELAETIQLELEAAARESEVKLAFDLDKLNDKHELVTNNKARRITH